MNTYYFILEVITILTNNQKLKLRNALLAFGRQSDDQPFRITHGRVRLDGQAVLIVISVDEGVTKSDFLDSLSVELGISKALINSNSIFTLMAGTNTEERAASARQYIIDNSTEWE